MKASFTDTLLVTLHRLLPARPLAHAVYLLSRSRTVWLKNLLIRSFARLYDVNLEEAAHPGAEAYASFNEFFTRELRPGARPLAPEPDRLLCPADGTVAQTGHVRDGSLLQAKGMQFSAAALLGDTLLAERLRNAPFATIYLAPYNYHRVHMPLAARLLQTRFIPGKLYSVNARTTAVIPNLYAQNERLVCEFESAAGPFAMVLVGAMNVASISAAWSGEIYPDSSGRIRRSNHENDRIELERGDYMGHFNLGSTVVLIGPAAGCEWRSDLLPGTTVRMGEALGSLASTAAGQ